MTGRALRLLAERAREGEPLRMGLVGAGTFGTMILSQAGRLDGLQVAGVADLDAGRAEAAIARAGLADRGIPLHSSVDGLLSAGVDVLVEATGAPAAGAAHALACIEAGVHVVMVNVEADVLAGPALAERARRAGVVYGMAFGDQPALICDLVDTARASGLEVVSAGKGTKYLPEYHRATPETVWGHYGLSPARAAEAGFNARMFTSFLDGTKSAIEMAAVANATGLAPQDEGLLFPPSTARGLASVAIPVADGGVLTRRGTVEVVSSLRRDGSEIEDDLRWGVYVVFAAGSPFVEGCFADYGLLTDASGRFAALYRPSHLIGLETTVSVLAAGLLGEPTGCPDAFSGDVACVAKRDLAAGEALDGEGGFAVHGALVPAARSVRERALPIGLAHGLRLTRAVAAGDMVRVDDVEDVADGVATRLRRETLSLAV